MSTNKPHFYPAEYVEALESKALVFASLLVDDDGLTQGQKEDVYSRFVEWLRTNAENGNNAIDLSPTA